MLITTKKRPPKRPDYQGLIQRHRRQIDPWMLPVGGLGDAGPAAIGIPAVDAVIAQTQTKIDTLILSLQIGAVLCAISAGAGLYLVVRDRRRHGA
jgi:hypothetical protein